MRRALLALALLAACSGDGEPDGAAPVAEQPLDELVPAAVEATLAEGTARLAVTTEIRGLAGNEEPLLAEGEGFVDFDGRRSSLVLDLASLLEAIGLPALGGEVETRSIGDDRWLRSPFFNSVLGVQTEWLLLDVTGTDAGEALGQLDALTGSDPSDQLRLVAGVDPGSVEEVGEEDVRGTGTTRYTATLDPQAALDAVPAADRERLAPVAEQLGTVPVDVELWIDDQGRIRRLTSNVPLPPAAGGGNAAAQLDLFDFGVGVDVAAPPDGDVTPASEITNPGP